MPGQNQKFNNNNLQNRFVNNYPIIVLHPFRFTVYSECRVNIFKGFRFNFLTPSGITFLMREQIPIFHCPMPDAAAGDASYACLGNNSTFFVILRESLSVSHAHLTRDLFAPHSD